MMYPIPRETNCECCLSYIDPDFESLGLSHSLGKTIEARNLEEGHCRKGKKVLMEGIMVVFNVNWPQIRITC